MFHVEHCVHPVLIATPAACGLTQPGRRGRLSLRVLVNTARMFKREHLEIERRLYNAACVGTPIESL